MSEQLHNKTILVTGAAKRVGAAIARRLHRAGAKLALHYHASEREAHALQPELNLQRAQSVILVKADLLETAGLAEIVKTCVERFGALDALVNHASAFYPTPVGAIDEGDWDEPTGPTPQVARTRARPRSARERGRAGPDRLARGRVLRRGDAPARDLAHAVEA